MPSIIIFSWFHIFQIFFTVCQILSPEVLQMLARPDKCFQVARDLWKNLFHKLYLINRDFSDVFQLKFDIGNYSTMQENQRCKVSIIFDQKIDNHELQGVLIKNCQK